MTKLAADRLLAGWRVSREPTPAQIAWSNEGGYLFASPDWARVLTTLSPESWFGWHADLDVGVVVPVFRRLGLRIGFLGFPVAGGACDSLDAEALSACAIGLATNARLDLIRVAQSQCNSFNSNATSARPEVWVNDLQAWRLANHKRLRKDLAFAHRAAPNVLMNVGVDDATTCYRLYASTVERYGARLKYNQQYFAALIELAKVSPFLEFIAAMEHGRVRGFAVLAVHGDVANYLHGAVDADGRRQGVSDLLLAELMERGQRSGCSRFNFMASPWEQRGLLAFKAKWGDGRGLAVTRDMSFTSAGHCVGVALRWQGRGDRRAAKDWTADR